LPDLARAKLAEFGRASPSLVVDEADLVGCGGASPSLVAGKVDLVGPHL